ncbi:MAG: glyoxalase/bleomycin resistance/extradiol dioxygenase family protein [Saprospiraceae bacterium]|nr:glyoxalase/bleomycin resistance/extradiol dioxygenase family protein [Saprospiraceae bacterium]MCB9325242.1 glyoxalase/bleomycin resistance/extradiol dioxygenase family protein [Lewinellaceae bacterium]
MKEKTEWLSTVPVLPSSDIERDLQWYAKHTGFEFVFGDHMFAGLQREQLSIFLQWHADTAEDPLLGGSVTRIFVKNIEPVFEEFVKRGTVGREKLRMNTPWGTHEFGFYDPNNNAVFIVEDI